MKLCYFFNLSFCDHLILDIYKVSTDSSVSIPYFLTQSRFLMCFLFAYIRDIAMNGSKIATVPNMNANAVAII